VPQLRSLLTTSPNRSSHRMGFKLMLTAAVGLCLLPLLTFAQTPAAPAAPETEQKAATEAPAASAEKPTEANQASADAAIPNNDQLLAEQVPADQVWWLNAGEDKFLGLYIAEATGRDSLGATLILPDPGRPADWPAITRTLRELLPQHRWATLAINPSTSNSTLQARIDSAIKQLRSKNITNIALIAEGKTALGALEYIQLHAGQLRAVVLLNPAHEALLEETAIATNSETPTEPQAAEKSAAEKPTTETAAKTTDNMSGQEDALLTRIGTLAIPCLDMATDSSIEGKQLAERRLDTSRRLKPGQYQQVTLPPNDRYGINNQDSPITKRIRGWLGKNALAPVAATPAQ
jgi:hypothetical protein